MTAYELPTSLNISGVDFSIRTDFRVIIDILIAMNDPELDDQAKAVVMLQILFEDWQNIPPEHLTEACQKACEFIDCGQTDDNPNKPKPRLMDWEQDGDLIAADVNRAAGQEVRSLPYLHWWTFLSFFHAIGQGQQPGQGRAVNRAHDAAAHTVCPGCGGQAAQCQADVHIGRAG